MPAVRPALPEAKRQVIRLVASGYTVKDGMTAVGRSYKSYENWRAADPDFAREITRVRMARESALRTGGDPKVAGLSFEDFRLKYLEQRTFSHQALWLDILEGREPQKLHPAMTFEDGDPSRVLITVPPNHGKSMTMSIEYPTYRICRDPNVRIIVVSKTQTMAKDFLFAIKQRLTSPKWVGLQTAYGGTDGFKGLDRQSQWTADRIYLGEHLRDSGEKDPTVQAIGMGGQIYGARADLIIVDDAVVLSNAAEFEKQIRWLTQEVASRLGPGGKLLVIGTRVAPVDMYSELRNPDRYISGRSPWTYLACPAVLRYAESPADWTTLWPKAAGAWEGTADQPDAKGLYPRWDGHHLSRVRNQIPARQWQLVYQQADVPDDATFPPALVMGSTNRARKPGPLKAGAWGHPRNGSEGMHAIMSWDPAGTGDAFVLIGSVDRVSGKRLIQQGISASHTTPRWYLEQLRLHADDYDLQDLVIEQNAYASWLIHDDAITEFCRSRGIRILPHYTGRNKQDPDFGVPSMASLFGGLTQREDGGRPDHDGKNLIELPDPDRSPGVKTLIEQLISWQPRKNARQLKMDGPMALWFFELRARQIIAGGRRQRQFYLDNEYLTGADRADRKVIRSDDAFRGFAG